MATIVTTIILITIFSLFALYYYTKPENKNKKLFRESISKNVFFITFIAPIVAAVIFTFLISLIMKEGDSEKFFRSDAILLTSMFYLYGVYSGSMGIHALAKVFKNQVLKIKDLELLSLVRFFHGPFSHNASNTSLTLILSLLSLFNSNHPSRDALTRIEILIIISCGIILGVGLAILYAVGSTMHIMRWFVLVNFIFLVFYENRTVATLIHAPLSVLILTIFTTSLTILMFDRFGPNKYWFLRKIDESLESVNKSWMQIIK